MHLSIVITLLGSLLSVSSSPANATPPTCYVVEDDVLINGEEVDDVLTDGSRCSGNVVIDDSVKVIGQYDIGYGAFQLSGITSVTIPASVTSILYGAFWDRVNLTSVTFAPGSNLTSIGRFAFAGTQNLRKITLPNSLTSIGSVAFSGSGIRYIVFEGAPPSVDAYNHPYLEGVSANVVAWVTPVQFDNFNSATPKIVPDIRQLTGNTPPPTIYSPSNSDTLTATVGITYSNSVVFFGVGSPVVDVSAGPLPPGISLNTTTGALSGTPTTVAPLETRTYPVTFRVTDGADSATVTINFEVLPPTPPTITGETFTSYVGIPMNKTLDLFTLGTRTVTVDNGALPPGVSISTANRIVGTPTEEGTFNARLKVTDSYGQFDTAEFTFDIESEPSVSISASQSVLYPTRDPDLPSYSVITVSFAPEGFILCSFYRDAKVFGSVYQRDTCNEWQDSSLTTTGLSSQQDLFDYFENTSWVIRLYGPDADSGDTSPEINTPFLATVTVNVSWESQYRNWQTPLPVITNGPKVGETVYASAFERELPRNLLKTEFQANTTDYPTPEEYVYRITKRPNESTTSVDHQSHSAYSSLNSAQQDNWYKNELGFDPDVNPYLFTWSAFMCVAYIGPEESLTATKPTGIRYNYASREDGVTGGTLNPADNLMFKYAAQDWISGQSTSAQITRSAVGSKFINFTYTQAFLGDPDGELDSYVWGLLDVSASCGAGKTFKALRIVAQDQNSPIVTKSFSIPATLKLADQWNNLVSVAPEGITIGVTGAVAAEGFNAALWGLTTIAGTVASPAPVETYVPVPVPYLRTLTNPKLNLANGKLICTAGAYIAGYALEGVILGNPTALFSPTNFTYNLLINGIAQAKLITTSSLSSIMWNLPAATPGSLLTCSISVTANSLTNTDSSNSDSTLVSAALKVQAQSISLAEGNYNTAVSNNSMAYKQSLVDNRAKWRKEIETIREDYSATLVRIKAEGNSRKATSDRSAALKIMVAAQKKSAADYKASQPAALEAKKSEDQAALEAKNLSIAKANTTYGTFIESIGYGVLIP